MGDNDDCILKSDEELLQPLNCAQIQVVGRLVKEQDIRIAEQGLGKQDLDLDRTLKCSHDLMVKLRLYAEAVEQGFRIRLGFPAVHLRELSLELSCFYAVLICEVFLHVEGILLFHDIIEPSVAHDDCVKDLVLIVFEVVLFQEGYTVTRSHSDGAARSVELAV